MGRIERHDVQRLIRHNAFKLGVLGFKLSEPLCLVDSHDTRSWRSVRRSEVIGDEAGYR
ncbi:MAG: hypothetical protein JWN98_2349 [Abditibacteriota bacterium]|nr:hypothetical protein [Abditibacteriota bacterium]